MNPAATVRSRILSIDILRGLVMIIMALDHVRDLFYNVPNQPLDLQTTTPFYFFTRWITHFCAPVFVALAGVSAYLMGLKMSKAQLSAFLIKRGIWLIFAELLLVSFGISFNPFYRLLILQVIWATGLSMIILGLIVRLPFRLILVIGLVIVLGHNLLDPIRASGSGYRSMLWDLFHGPSFRIYPLGAEHRLVILYSFISWTGIMILGYCLGSWFSPAVEAPQRRKRLLLTGSAMILLFVLLRSGNFYGDPVDWAPQRNAVFSFLSFINVNKYPPSLQYILVTIGPGLIFLALIESHASRFTRFLGVFGRVPFFYYLIHFYLIHLFLVIAFFWHGYGVNDIRQRLFFFQPDGFYFNLGTVYAVWALTIICMYPLCRWYDRYKGTHKQWWLKYI